MTITRTSICRIVLSACAAITVAACSPGDVALEGKIFEAAGMAGSQAGGGRNVRMSERAPLVVPPDANRLPSPGETGSNAEADAVLAAIDDPDRKKTRSKADLEKAQAAYCKENYELPKARGDTMTADTAVGPLGSCKPSILTSLKKWNETPSE